MPKKDKKTAPKGTGQATEIDPTVLATKEDAKQLQGIIASRPVASDSRHFFYATDEEKLYYDDGNWVEIRQAEPPP